MRSKIKNVIVTLFSCGLDKSILLSVIGRYLKFNVVFANFKTDYFNCL